MTSCTTTVSIPGSIDATRTVTPCGPPVSSDSVNNP